MTRSLLLPPALLAALLASLPAHASPAELYGFGARAMGRAQGGLSLPGDGGSALLNPAALSGNERSQALFGYALVRFDLREPPPIYWDTNRDGRLDDTDTPLDLGAPVDRGDGTMIGVNRAVTPRFGVGLSLFVPTDRLLRLQTIEPSVPTYFMYTNRTQRYALAVGVGGAPVRGLHLGAGARLISSSVINVDLTLDATLDGDSADGDAGVDDVVSVQADIHDLSFDLKPTAVPVFGLRWEVDELVPALKGVAVGAVWRGQGGFPVEVNIDGQINGTVDDVGELDPTVLAAVAQATIQVYDHYLPQQLQLGASWSFREAFHVYLDAHYTRWSGMNLAVSRIVDSRFDATLADLSDLELEDGNATVDVTWQDTWGVRTGTELFLPPFSLPGEKLTWMSVAVRGGFGYAPTPLVSQGPGTALLDADRMLFGVGLGVAHGPLWDVIEGPVHYDVFLQYHTLAQGTLERSVPDGRVAGYPAGGEPIPIGGRFLAGGFQWSFEY